LHSNLRLAIGGILFVFFLAGAIQIRVTDDASSGMLPTDEVKVARYEDFLSRFPNDQSVIIIFENLLCSNEGWQLLQQLEEEALRLSSVSRAYSVNSRTARYVQVTPDEIDFSVFADVQFQTAVERCEAAYSYSPFREVYVTDHGSTGALLLLTERGADAVSVSTHLRELVSRHAPRALELGGDIILTGEPIMSAEVSRVIAKDTVYIVVNVVIMLTLLYLVTRSITTVASALCLIVFVLSASYGTMGWLGVTLTPATSLVVFLLVPLSSAFVVHAHGYRSRSGLVHETDRTPRVAFLLAGVTTAIGFASTGLTPAEDIQRLAVMGFLGIGAATAGVFLIVFPILESRGSQSFTMELHVPLTLLARPVYGYVFFAALVTMTAYGLSQVTVNYGPTNYLPQENPARADFDRAGKHFGRMNLPLLLNVTDAESPDPWQALVPLVRTLNTKYPTGFQVLWFYDPMSEVTRAFTMDPDGDFELFPTDAALFSQLLILFDPEDLEIFMDDAREHILIMFQIPFEGSRDYFDMKRVVDGFLRDNKLDGYFVGRVSSFFETGHRMGSDTLRGLSVGGLVIFIVLWYLFRSLPLAVAGIVVNTLPVFAGLAALGILQIDIDLGSSIVAAIAFGIVLDDSTHLLVRVRDLVGQGYDPSTAVARAVDDLILPIVSTTAIICVGFSVLLLAEMQTFNDFAVVILITLISALATDLLVLPLLVRRFFRDPVA